jgi:galactofuranosylgalactofuranosylrhamnosyl-N-acetylglucosaminyl-diphospho-decaprenol beta-1,5/1,6-galactofuranosyltransferase
VVFPENADIDVVPLYWDVDQASFAAPTEDLDDGEIALPHFAVGTVNLDHLLDRRRAIVPAGHRASTATYFNAFPASYWRRWTRVREVVLTVRASGEGGRVSVYKSTPDGRLQRVQTSRFSDGEAGARSLEFRLPLSTFADGGWYWFDLIAGHDDLVLEGAWYEAEVPEEVGTGTATMSITTFNRPSWCVDLLAQLAVACAEIPEIDLVQVVDQGDQKVVDDPRFADVSRRLDQKLRVIDQANLGGAGGFSRGMLETSRAGRSTYVLLLDDDVQVERESIRRALVFADLCRRPTIVGGHMFSAYSRASLHSLGEVVNRWKFWWGPAAKVEEDHDFGIQSLRATPWLHRRIDVDYNGWWMCLIPIEVVKTIGLALPVFIKWDDAEYGLRAGAAGFPTVSLPGVALWHVPWTDKDDALDWQAYFHQRNRLLTALLHSPYRRGGTALRESFAHQVKHILSMQYSTAALRLMAMEDLLEGPEHLHGTLPAAVARIRDARGRYDDAGVRADAEDFPAPWRRKPARRGVEPTKPTGKPKVVLTAALGAVRQALPVPDEARDHPEVVVPAMDSYWWRLSGLNSAVVSTRDGAGAAWYRRDQRLAADVLRRSIAAHNEMLRQWPELAERYRGAAPGFTGEQEWASTLGVDRQA